MEPIYLLVIPAIQIAIGLFVFRRSPKDPQHWSFGLLTLSIALWGIANFTEPYFPLELQTYVARITFAAASLIASSLLIFAIALDEKKENLSLIMGLMIIGTVFALLSLTSAVIQFDYIYSLSEEMRQYGWAHPVFSGYFLSFILLALFLLIERFRKASGAQRYKIGYILLGTFLSTSIGTTTNLLIPMVSGNPTTLGAVISMVGPLSTIFFTLCSAYAILKYRFLNIRVILKKSVTQTLLVALFIGLAAFFVGMLGNAVEQSFEISAWVSAGIIAVVLAAAYLPFQRTISRIVNYVFATALPRPAEIPKDVLALKEEATAVVENVLHRQNIEIILLAEMASRGWRAEEIAALDEFVQLKKTALVFNAIAGMREHESEHATLLNILERALFEREVAVAVPMVNKDMTLIGCILLGAKKGDAFREDEIVYVKAFACGMGFRFGEMLKDAAAAEQSEKTQITQA